MPVKRLLSFFAILKQLVAESLVGWVDDEFLPVLFEEFDGSLTDLEL
jgi:hypothetical protein